MSEAWTLALIGFGGALLGALITAFIQPWWGGVIGPKARLNVDIRPQDFSLPRNLLEAVNEYRFNSRLNVRPTEDAREKLGAITSASTMILVTISNNSSTAITGVAVQAASGDPFLSDLEIDGIGKPTYYGRLQEIGLLRARSHCTLRIWLRSSLATTRMNFARESVRVSADSFDKLRVTVHAPEFIRGAYRLVPRSILWNGFFLALTSAWLLFIWSTSS